MVYQSIQKKENENMCLKNRLLQLTLVVLSLAIGMQAQDRANCSNATLHGSYGLRATGRTLAGGDIVVLGRFTYDGNGNLTARLFNRLPNAANETFTLTGTYSVSSDCTVSDVWHPDNGGADSTHESVLVNQEKGFFILNTTEGAPVVISGEARRQ